MQFLEKSERDLDKLVEQMCPDEGDVKTEFSIEEADSQDSSPVQYQLKPIFLSPGKTSDSLGEQTCKKTSSTEVITLSSDEDGGGSQENISKRFKPWPKKVDPDEPEFYHFDNSYSHLETQSDSE